MRHLLFGDVQVVADVAREEAGLQIPFPRGHVGSVEGGGQLMVGGFQHLLRQHQFGIVHTKDIDAAFRFGMYGDDGQIEFSSSPDNTERLFACCHSVRCTCRAVPANNPD